MDSEEDGCVVVGCAGGLRSDLSASLTLSDIPEGYSQISVEIKGLMGGHSGENINSGRANANKLMARALGEVLKTTDLRLCFMEGGSKENAIPRECRVVVAVEDKEKAKSVILHIASEIAAELSADDSAFALNVSDTDKDYLECAGKMASRAVINVMNTVANGVLAMSMDVKGLVEFSRNMGVVRFASGSLNIVLSSRSAIESQLDYSISQLDATKELLEASSCGELSAEITHYSRYPGWRYSKVSPLRDSYMRVYEKLFGSEASARIIHAGLECGIISSNLPDMDIISIGPNMKDIHSPAEALDLRSCERFFITIKEMLLEK